MIAGEIEVIFTAIKALINAQNSLKNIEIWAFLRVFQQ